MENGKPKYIEKIKKDLSGGTQSRGTVIFV